MEWFKTSNATGIDSYISDAYYSGASDTCGINLRLEMAKILKDPNCGKGHWIAYRRYDRTNPSQYYKKSTKEGAGGPAYEYTDTAILTRRVPLGLKGTKEERDRVGVGIQDAFIYYFEYDLNPKRGDHIYELVLGPGEQTSSPNLTTTEYVERYKIVVPHPYRLHHGRIEYWAVICEYDEIGW